MQGLQKKLASLLQCSVHTIKQNLVSNNVAYIDHNKVGNQTHYRGKVNLSILNQTYDYKGVENLAINYFAWTCNTT